MISSTVACDLSLHHIAPQQRARTAFPARRNLLTNCQAQDISTYRFPLLRATSRRPADRSTGRADGMRETAGNCGCGVTAHVFLPTDMSNAARTADIISRMAWRVLPG
jgi:hypothetical protein